MSLFYFQLKITRQKNIFLTIYFHWIIIFIKLLTLIKNWKNELRKNVWDGLILKDM